MDEFIDPTPLCVNCKKNRRDIGELCWPCWEEMEGKDNDEESK